MNKEELVIWVDDEDHELGRLPRSVVHAKDHLLLHREAMVILFSNAAHTEFWLQLRSPTKEQYPNYWTLGVTCHVNSEDISADDPEGYLSAAKREGSEELGITINNSTVERKVVIETAINHALAAIVVAECLDVPKPDGDEVVEVRKFDVNSVNQIRDKLTPAALFCLKQLELIEGD